MIIFLENIRLIMKFIKTEIEQGLLQVDDFNITEFSADFDSNTRKLDISFQSESSDGTILNIDNSYN